MAIKMCRWRSKGDFARFCNRLFLRAFSKSRKYDFLQVSGFRSVAGVSQQALGRCQASDQSLREIRALDPFWCATLFLRDARIFYGVVFDLISMASRGLPWRFFWDPRDPRSENGQWELAAAFGRWPVLWPGAGCRIRRSEECRGGSGARE